MSSGEHEECTSDLDLEELKTELQAKGKVLCPAVGCDEDFKSIWGLKFHLKKSSCTVAKFRCDDCGHVCQSRIALQAHSTECQARNGGAKPIDVVVKTEHREQQGQEGTIEKVETPKNQRKAKGKTRKPSPSDADVAAPVRRSGRARTPRKLPVIEHPEPKRKRKATKVDYTSDEDDLEDGDDGGAKRMKTSRRRTSENENMDVADVSDDRVTALVEVKVEEINEEENKDVENEIVETKSDNSVKKRGRGRPKTIDTQNDKTAKGKRGRPKKTIPLQDVNSEGETEDIGTSNGQPVDDEEEETADDDYDNKKAPEKKKKPELSLLTQMKKKLRHKKTVVCPQKCGSSFISAKGYVEHVKTCGVEFAERTIFSCEECGKEYRSKAGLKYHMGAAHPPEVIVEEEDTQEKGDGDTAAQPEETSTRGKPLRRSAARARERVKDLINKDPLVASTRKVTAGLYSRQTCYLDKFIKNQRPHIITRKLKQEWRTDHLKTGEVTCPNKDCGKVFATYDGIRAHYPNCGFDTRVFLCTICNHDFGTLTGSRMHVSSYHTEVEEENSQHLVRDGVVQTLVYSGDDNETDHDFEVNEMELEEELEEEEEEEEDFMVDEGAEDEEVLSEDEEVEELVWSAHFQRYISKKRQTERRSTNPASGRAKRKSPDPSDTRCTAIITAKSLEDKMAANTKWRKQFLSSDTTHPSLQPTLKHWTRAKERDIVKYIPTAHASPYFHISREGTKKTADKQLPLFKGLTKSSSGDKHGDLTFNVGGPVWSMDWCPFPDDRLTENQYLLISTHRSIHSLHLMDKRYQEKGLLQLWNVGVLKSTSIGSGNTPKLVLGITHEYGPIWQASWCPRGAWQRPNAATSEEQLPRLGVVALACGDGIVRIISVPHPKKLLKELQVDNADNSEADNSEDVSHSQVMVEARSHLELVPGPLGVTYDGRRGQAFCANWSPDPKRERIVAGYSDGTVCIWNLQTESPLLKSQDNDPLTTRLSPYIQINAHLTVVRHVAWCESDSNFILTGCLDKNCKVWNLQSTSAPVYAFRRGLPCEISWPSHSVDWMYSEDNLHAANPSLRYRSYSSITDHPSIVWSFSVSPWTELSASVDSQGSVKVNRGPMKKSSLVAATISKLTAEKLSDSPQTAPETTMKQPETTTKQPETTMKQEPPSEPSEENSVNGVGACGGVSYEDHIDMKNKRRDDASKYRLVYQDSNQLLSQDVVKWDKQEETQIFGGTTLTAIHKVRWNPNKQAATWLATGGAAGLVRVHIIKKLSSS